MRKAILLAIVTLMALTMMAGTAFAEGYNNGGINFSTGANELGYGDNAGLYVRQPASAVQTESARGPHGGYSVSTNKCADCHSTHYALGAFVLMRSDKREDACTFCHQGGGGSIVNIQMDNSYDATGVIASDPASRGKGTGHTLGYAGSSPADIKPAFTPAGGLQCFSCHTPHGNSARVLDNPANPGAAIDVFTAGSGAIAPYNGVVREVLLNHSDGVTPSTKEQSETILATMRIMTPGPLFGMYDLNKPTQSQWDAICKSAAGTPQKTARWGVSPFAENMVFRRGTLNPLTGGVADSHAITRPIFKKGKWLLIKNPNVKIAEQTITVYDWSLTGQSTKAWPDNNSNGTTGALNTPTRDTGDGPPTRPLRGTVLVVNAGSEVPNTAVGFRFWSNVSPASKNAAFVDDGYVAGNVAVGVDAASWAGYARATQTTKGLMNTTAAPKRDSARIYLNGAWTVDQINGVGAGPFPTASDWVGAADAGVNKYAIDWKNALGPADQMSLDEQESDRNQAYPFTASPTSAGFGSVNEMCVDCHAGTAGASTQKANVFLPSATGGSYMLAYSHDAQPRH